MNQRTIGAIGLLITTFFVSGFLSLFIYNPLTLEEVNNIPSIAAYNLDGMNGRWLAVFNYFTVGLLNLIFGVGLFKLSKNELPIIIGKILILGAGFIWLSFGIQPWVPDTDSDVHTIAIKVILFLLIAPFGFIFLGIEFEKVMKDKFSKYYTLVTGITMLLLGILSVFVFNDKTWIRTNISLILYFLWFGVIGQRLYCKIIRAEDDSN